MAQFELEYLGLGPKAIHAYLLDDLLVVRLSGVLSAAEHRLVQSQSVEKGRDLLKRVRRNLIETSRPVVDAMVEQVTGVKIVSLHHDISTLTGEEVILFSLSKSPVCREPSRK